MTATSIDPQFGKSIYVFTDRSKDLPMGIDRASARRGGPQIDKPPGRPNPPSGQQPVVPSPQVATHGFAWQLDSAARAAERHPSAEFGGEAIE